MTKSSSSEAVGNQIESIINSGLSKEDTMSAIRKTLIISNEMQKMESSLFILKEAGRFKDQETRMVLLEISEKIKKLNSNYYGYDLNESVARVLFSQSHFGEGGTYEELSDYRKSFYLVFANSIVARLNSHIRDLRYDIYTMATITMRNALNLHDEGQFDPDLIRSYKDQVVNEFIDKLSEENENRK